MSAADSSALPPHDAFAAEPSFPSTNPREDRWQRWDAWLLRFSERLNPILVKEARQALKSRQFSLTFTLLLVFGWLWSIYRVTSGAPAIYFAPSGGDLLYGYFLILSVPMFVIIPFSAFRSLAIEREDGTFDLLSITTLSARQIVTGKLGSAALQMIVYYSAISPCIAFTYMLRGIDVLTILFVLVWTFFLSIGLATIGLLCATITRARHWQSVLSVLVIVGLLIANFSWCVVIYAMLFEGGPPFDDVWFVVAISGLFVGLISFCVLFVQAAASRISFASDNCSTRLRVTMLTQQVLFLGWTILCVVGINDREVPYAMVTLAGLYWTVAGAIMTGESSKVAPRVLRQLPQSFAARTFLTWFYPGSATGYFFAVANLLAFVAVLFGVTAMADLLGADTSRIRPVTDFEWIVYGLTLVAYVTLYLGTGRLLYLLARRSNPESLLLAFLIQFFLAITGAGLPWFLQSWLSNFQNTDYTPMQFTNWAWTLGEVASSGRGVQAVNVEISLMLLAFFSVVVFALNLFTSGSEIDRSRQESPERILEDELALHPERQPKTPRLSPWDE